MKQYRYFALTEGKNPQEPTGLLRELETDSEYFLEYLDEDGQWVLDFELATYIFGESPNSVQVNDAAAREIARKIAPAKKFHLAGTEDDHDQSDHAPNNGKGSAREIKRPESYFNGWPAKDRELVALGDKIASYFDEPHLIEKVGESIPERQVEELLASRKETEAAAIMRGGKLEHFWNGAESVVKIPESVDLAGATLIHNHPLGASLSINDIVAASKDKLAEIRAVGRFDDATYSFAARPDVAWPPEAAIRSAYAENEMRLLTAFAAKRQEKGYTKEQLNFAASHAIIKATLRQLGLKYEVRRWT